LFGHQAEYTEALHRFADYNAGVYASRNAAIQAQVARLTGAKLAWMAICWRTTKRGSLSTIRKARR
jgi:hypothetical protein